jgi:hypothetical protein
MARERVLRRWRTATAAAEHPAVYAKMARPRRLVVWRVAEGRPA